ncbi:MAG: SpoIVB peptidase S55 domain-containing protein [Bacillota bacterium]|nr:SpoIVB peptidase S55 domain-containing protein [Bacillota bacterium]HPU61303.1 SpoIVB peptidase S55 domain-containing protein [Bacillota bacterium]
MIVGWINGKSAGKKLFTATVAVVLGLLLIGFGVFPYSEAEAQQDPEFMPISQVMPGMKGIAKTVFSGTKIDTFDIEVLAVMKGGAASGDYVLIKASGDAIEAVGGLASGMSGSPVYVDGRLIGAITHALDAGSDPYLGLVTPIGEILRVFEAQQGYHVAAGPLGDPVVVSEGLKTQLGLDTEAPLVMAPVKSPVMLSGIRGRAFQSLAEKLKGYGLQPVSAGIAQAPSTQDEVSLEPGSAVGVQLMRGDVSATVIGTATYKKGDLVVAFGHEVLLMGKAGYIATAAEVHRVVSSILRCFKVGSPLNVVGAVTQDRSTGVLVELGGAPRTIPVALTVKDKDTGAVRTFSAEIVKSEALIDSFLFTFLIECLDSAIDRIGQGTSLVSFEINTENLDTPISRENMFYSFADISAMSTGELLDVLVALVDNEFQEVDVTEIKAYMEIEEQRKTARILHAEAEKEDVLPGETVEIKVSLRPYRGEPEIKSVYVEIPEYAESGTLYLTVRGGGTLSSEEEEQDTKDDGSPVESLEKYIRDMTEREKNNEIVVEFFPGREEEFDEAISDEAIPIDEGVLETDTMPLAANLQVEDEIPQRAEETAPRLDEVEMDLDEPDDLVKVVVSTDYVIEGETELKVTVIR